MARTINAPFVDFNGHKYKPGEEEALAKVLPKRDIETFVKHDILEGDWSDAGELPRVRDLEEHLGTLETAEEVRSLQGRDDRKSAAPLYEARLAEIAESEGQ
jgi:hypothetical protein